MTMAETVWQHDRMDLPGGSGHDGSPASGGSRLAAGLAVFTLARVWGGFVIKEAAATVFVFRQGADRKWLLRLVLHPGFGEWFTDSGPVDRGDAGIT